MLKEIKLKKEGKRDMKLLLNLKIKVMYIIDNSS